jgi:hypothetical protein
MCPVRSVTYVSGRSVDLFCVRGFSMAIRQSPTTSWWMRFHRTFHNQKRTIAKRCIAAEQNVLIVRTTHADAYVEESQLKWSEVVSALAFKRDCFAIDLLCVSLGGPSGAIEINEEMTGWSELVESTLPKKLPGCKPFHEWFQGVAFPAFKTNPVGIFSRDRSQHPSD